MFINQAVFFFGMVGEESTIGFSSNSGKRKIGIDTCIPGHYYCINVAGGGQRTARF